ncbi:MAG: ribosome maturation factor RimP [Caldibacillus sp.]
MSKVTETVEKLALPIVEELGLEIYDIEYVKEGKNWFLRVYIDKESGVGIEECEIVSERLSEKLDEIDPIPHNYYLEVSSPGAERPLKKPEDYKRAIGKKVVLRTYEAIDGQKEFHGVLTGFDGEQVTIEIMIKARKKIVTIPFEKIAKARLSVF